MEKVKTISNNVDKLKYINEVWEILIDSYKDIKGGFLFKDRVDLLQNSSEWKVVLYKQKVVAVFIFKSKLGRKIVAFGRDNKYGKLSLKILARNIEKILHYAWIEVSEKAEEFILKYCNVHNLIIHNSIIESFVNKKIFTTYDGYHYIREIAGMKKTKIAIGKIVI